LVLLLLLLMVLLLRLLPLLQLLLGVVVLLVLTDVVVPANAVPASVVGGLRRCREAPLL
jgi:hypothetical protein